MCCASATRMHCFWYTCLCVLAVDLCTPQQSLHHGRAAASSPSPHVDVHAAKADSVATQHAPVLAAPRWDGYVNLLRTVVVQALGLMHHVRQAERLGVGAVDVGSPQATSKRILLTHNLLHAHMHTSQNRDEVNEKTWEWELVDRAGRIANATRQIIGSPSIESI